MDSELDELIGRRASVQEIRQAALAGQGSARWPTMRCGGCCRALPRWMKSVGGGPD